jgi:polysaccharide export outer membrane protein
VYKNSPKNTLIDFYWFQSLPLPVQILFFRLLTLTKFETLARLGLRGLISCGLSVSIFCLNDAVWGQNNPQVPLAGPNNPGSVRLPNNTFGSSDPIPPGAIPPRFENKTSEPLNLYRLNVGDAVTVTLPDFPEFGFTGVIDNEGKVQVPILGRVAIAGLTLDEIEAKIGYELHRRYLQDVPTVSAVLTSSRPLELMIVGEIVRPGYYIFPFGTVLSTVLATAGGTTEQADLRSVIIRRTLIDGSSLEERVDLYTPLLQGGQFPQLRLQGGDTIIVAKREIGKDRDYDQRLIAKSNLIKPNMTVRVLLPSQPTGIAVRSLVLPSGSTFLDAVASLPATVPLVLKEDVTLLRFDPQQGKVVARSLNPTGMVENFDVSQNVPLQDNDVIVVSRTILGDIFEGFRVLTQPIRDVFGLASFVLGLPGINQSY